MADDDLDLDLDLGPDIPPVKPKSKSPSATVEQPAKVMPDRKPGVIARMGSSVSGQLTHINRPNWNFRNFLVILAILIALVVLIENWSGVRISFLGLRLELPKAIAFLLNIFLGGLLTWLWLRRRPAARED